MAFFKDWEKSPPGNPFGCVPIPKLMEMLTKIPQDGFISTGFNGLPVMTVFDKDLKQIGMIHPHREELEMFES